VRKPHKVGLGGGAFWEDLIYFYKNICNFQFETIYFLGGMGGGSCASLSINKKANKQMEKQNTKKIAM